VEQFANMISKNVFGLGWVYTFHNVDKKKYAMTVLTDIRSNQVIANQK
jgi:hypothetical protein